MRGDGRGKRRTLGGARRQWKVKRLGMLLNESVSASLKPSEQLVGDITADQWLSGHSIPEHFLWSAVLEKAIDDLLRGCTLRTKRNPSVMTSARDWFLSDSDDIGSFVFISQHLNQSPDYLRRKLASKLFTS